MISLVSEFSSQKCDKCSMVERSTILPFNVKMDRRRSVRTGERCHYCTRRQQGRSVGETVCPLICNMKSSDTAISQVTVEEATAKSTQMNIMFMETSAKAGHNVKSLFKKIALSLPGMEKEGQADAQNTSMFFTPYR